MGVDNLWSKPWVTCDHDGEGGESKRIYEQINDFTGIYKYW